jgi:aryl-alcohol dehydrogenase-like predicted oxidoreductase
MQKDTNKQIKGLDSYYLLGRSGLRVSPLCLGTMTFGTEWGWGSEAKIAKEIFIRYIEAGGNFVDTADGYTDGHSEEILGQLIQETKTRDQLVLSTKFTFNAQPGNPNAGGNGRKNIYRALEGSLRRLQTDYVDLYWLHAWDGITPLEEVLSTLNDLVHSGKVRYIGFSDVPAWYLARAQTIAQLRGFESICALQLEYSLVERSIEREHIPAASNLGMSICPWSPLASGLLTGKYRRTSNGIEGKGRLQAVKDSNNPVFDKFNDRNWNIVEHLIALSKEIGHEPAQVAINWITKRPGVTSTLIGATTPKQFESNLRSLEFDIPEVLSARIEEVGRPEPVFPYLFFASELQEMVTGGVKVQAEPKWFRG